MTDSVSGRKPRRFCRSWKESKCSWRNCFRFADYTHMYHFRGPVDPRCRLVRGEWRWQTERWPRRLKPTLGSRIATLRLLETLDGTRAGTTRLVKVFLARGVEPNQARRAVHHSGRGDTSRGERRLQPKSRLTGKPEVMPRVSKPAEIDL